MLRRIWPVGAIIPGETIRKLPSFRLPPAQTSLLAS